MSETKIKIVETDNELRNVYRFRYNVYVKEIERRPIHADHQAGIFRHPLDKTAVNIAAYDKELNVIGAVRINFGTDGPFGCFHEFYDISSVGSNYLTATCIVTGLMVTNARRGGPLATRLSLACYECGLQRGVRWCFSDCIPSLSDLDGGTA